MNRNNTGNFDRVAPIYDRLARLVFGNALIESQRYFLNRIADHNHVLILGGGTGELLEHLLHAQPACSVCYIDASEKMIALSRIRVGETDRIEFICGTENSIPEGRQFDVIITNFYLDLFTEKSLQEVILQVTPHLKRDGIWLATDFVKTNNLFDNALLRLMYLFFKVTSDIEPSHLPDWRSALKKHVTEIQSASFRKGFIMSTVFGP